ncbi:MAG: UDP-2,3-diacylglucosamine diphosphatase [Gemmatimonadota bacterium]|nr:UDP-2,3-diacylglucosamine diphosphatase [Gemmatimonadota bacterium]
MQTEPSIFGAVLGHTLVVVSDAHLGVAPPAAEQALLSFLEAAPALGDCLLVNGDLFDFWFSYQRVIPRRGFHVAAALARLRRRMPIVMTGGNHDRWGGDFWDREIGIRFEPLRATFEIGRRRVVAIHGDGLTEPRLRATLLHRAINHPITAAVYRAIHPELGLRIVDALSPHLGDHTPTPAKLADAAAKQRAWAENLLAREDAVGLVIMGHTHQPALAEPVPGRQYVNPGAWFDGFRYVVATESGAELRCFSPATPPLPVPDDRR